jgi:hypothetical protein
MCVQTYKYYSIYSQVIDLLQVTENSRLSIQIYFIAVFVKIANVACARSKPYRQYRVLIQVNSNLTGDY